MKKHIKPHWFIAVLALLLAPHDVSAQSQGNDQREEFQDAYKEQKQKRSSFLGGAPSYNLTPRRYNVGFALGIEPVDVSIEAAEPEDTSQNTLDMTGYTVVPTVAFFGSTFGVGVSGEMGTRTVKYLQQIDPTTAEAEYFFEQYSETQYVGTGLYGYVLFPKKFMPRVLKGTFILGGRALTVDVNSRGLRTDTESIPDTTKLKYDVTIMGGGINLALTLAKRYQICPWINYQKTSFGSVKDENQSSDELSEDTVAATELDRSLIWQSNADVTYGIDLAMQFTNLDVHFGGLLGYVANTSRSAARIKDRALAISISYYFAPPEE